MLSLAISTSIIRPLAASRLVFWAAALSFENWSLDTEPPFSARRVATFCSAWVNTATETSPSSNAAPVVADPNEKVVLPFASLNAFFVLV